MKKSCSMLLALSTNEQLANKLNQMIIFRDVCPPYEYYSVRVESGEKTDWLVSHNPNNDIAIPSV